MKCANDRAVSWNSGRLPADNEVRRPFKADRRPPDFITLTGVAGGASDDIAVIPTVWRRRSRDGTQDLAEQVAPDRRVPRLMPPFASYRAALSAPRPSARTYGVSIFYVVLSLHVGVDHRSSARQAVQAPACESNYKDRSFRTNSKDSATSIHYIVLVICSFWFAPIFKPLPTSIIYSQYFSPSSMVTFKPTRR